MESLVGSCWQTTSASVLMSRHQRSSLLPRRLDKAGERRGSAKQASVSWGLLRPGMGRELDLSWTGEKFSPQFFFMSPPEHHTFKPLPWQPLIKARPPQPLLLSWTSHGMGDGCWQLSWKEQILLPKAPSHPWQDRVSPGSLPETCPAGTGEAVTCGHGALLQGTSWKRKHKSLWLCGFLQCSARIS